MAIYQYSILSEIKVPASKTVFSLSKDFEEASPLSEEEEDELKPESEPESESESDDELEEDDDFP